MDTRVKKAKVFNTQNNEVFRLERNKDIGRVRVIRFDLISPPIDEGQPYYSD